MPKFDNINSVHLQGCLQKGHRVVGTNDAYRTPGIWFATKGWSCNRFFYFSDGHVACAKKKGITNDTGNVRNRVMRFILKNMKRMERNLFVGKTGGHF